MRSSEIEQLKTFKKCLDIDNKIGKTISLDGIISHRVQFGDVDFYKWLIGIGLMPNKSKSLGAIDVPDRYFVDFLRGHLDGDGSITTYLDKYNTKIKSKYVYRRLFVRFISASQNHINWLHSKIIKNLKISGRCYVYKSKRKNQSDIFTIKFMKKKSLDLLNKIYYSDDIPCLSRKRLIYRSFLLQNK